MAKTRIIAEPGMPQVVVTREFAASRELLFRAHTDPELFVRWLGPRSLSVTIDHLDVRDGGTWRYVSREANGSEYGFHGVYHGTPSPDRIVQTFEFEGMPGHVALETITFEERGGRTLLRQNTVFQSVADRNGMVQSGMERGINDSMERLDELIVTLSPVT